jgi:hypothetical protein
MPLKDIFYGFLGAADERVVYGVPKAASEFFGDFLKLYHQRRFNMKKKMRHIYNSDASDRVEYFNQLKFTEARCCPQELDSPVATSVCGSQVVITHWSKNPQTIVIVNDQIAAAYQRYFEVLWKMCGKFGLADKKP